MGVDALQETTGVDAVADALAWAALEAARHWVDVLIMPNNTRDIPGFYLNRQNDTRQVLDELGNTGCIGCEYRPQAGMQVGGTSAGLGWLKPYL